MKKLITQIIAWIENVELPERFLSCNHLDNYYGDRVCLCLEETEQQADS